MATGADAVKVLVVGGGGREHALCWKLAKSPRAAKIYCAPGNGGTAKEPKVENVPIAVSDFEALSSFARERKIDLVVIGPDNPLADGIVDYMQGEGLRVFGPVKEAAKLEWSKAHAKVFMQKANLPTCRFMVCHSLEEATRCVKEKPWARVVKADGLALGKGVFVCDTEAEALAALEEIFVKGSFGEAGKQVLLEERLAGEEMSLLYFVDGKNLVAMPCCQDHKRRFDGDRGPNTGGMGAYSPVSLFDSCRDEIEKQITQPLKRALQEGLLDYKGVLYAGLMVVESPQEGNGGVKRTPYVLEFNARFGDPETQVLLPLLQSDLLDILWSCTDETLSEEKVIWSLDAACCVVAVADTYPSISSKGQSIEIGSLPPHVMLFHSGTQQADNALVTNGGRILCATALAADMESARQAAYKALQSISFKGMDWRKDIAGRAAKACLSN
jgi:phosphoribosylamine--glycine ligase